MLLISAVCLTMSIASIALSTHIYTNQEHPFNPMMQNLTLFNIEQLILVSKELKSLRGLIMDVKNQTLNNSRVIDSGIKLMVIRVRFSSSLSFVFKVLFILF